ncbi:MULTISPECIES: preprotein translocase subunit SecY [Thermoactinomyces]|jgi:preprotein translocase subunit SecY|uniref:Protein translocase subunit SecY n=1 Tax=Thermoactinomyces vulgaris TaxID=2026 RepID=A0ABS0QKY9_THEVU|nr:MULTISPECIES: preprotein translocase subunit SecY [Thermoactinomyces]KFZ39521.1 preprotein translocase subunit SecY [Thermoactinomyces sp. Gus2-1]KYQ85785.1 preprotein translocase subunit SecY [Thermoactinomyces sp. AS95]MBA4552361.1 preprotein translocase subunit SecY [Thermoactinomyces vulgaris]MBA4596684.1 preprotein translocase subunit SecY [Thermoactinomyces vulgaris]MBH8584305.1 preprotein translocase subunit SecY [Thermoactinomyces sp. CICC 10735]
MIRNLGNIFKVEDLRRRILYTLMMLVIFRIGSFIPVPNTNAEALQMLMDQAQGVFGLINAFSGGAFTNFSIFAMGIMPYITASIIVQLLTMDVIPAFARWAKEGEVGRRKLAQFTRYFTIVLGLIQSIGLSIGFNRYITGFIEDQSVWSYALISLTLTAGTAFLMWMGEQITEKGIGNGISILIFAGIVAAIPSHVGAIYNTLFVQEDQLFLGILKAVGILLVVILVVIGVIYIQQGVRRIPVQYTKRVVGRKMYGGQSTHIPMKINAAGVIPVIFALALLMFPVTIASFWQGHPVADWIQANFTYTQFGLGMVLYVILIIGFSYFYTFVQINPIQLADQMKKNGGFIPGIRPGKNTSTYLTKVMNRLTLTGSVFLAAVSILPIFFINFSGLPSTVQIGGTSLLIVVGVALETMKTIESQLIRRHYKGFMHK